MTKIDKNIPMPAESSHFINALSPMMVGDSIHMPTCDLCDKAGEIRIFRIKTQFGNMQTCICRECCDANYPATDFAKLEVA